MIPHYKVTPFSGFYKQKTLVSVAKPCYIIKKDFPCSKRGSKMTKIHPSSVVMDGAELDDGVEIGPLCYVGPHVKIGAGTRLIAQCNVDGYTTLGKNNTVFPFCALGQAPQDLSFSPDTVTYLNIGDGNAFREGSIFHPGTAPGSASTIGSNCLFMGNTHAGHDCKIGNNVIFANGTVIAGHVEIQDHAILSGLVGVHQFCRVGRFAIISGNSAFSLDIPPFMMAEGRNGGVRMFNKIGLQRAGFSEEAMNAVKHLFRIFYREGLPPKAAIEKIRAEVPQLPEVLEFIEFCESSKRGVISANAGRRNE